MKKLKKLLKKLLKAKALTKKQYKALVFAFKATKGNKADSKLDKRMKLFKNASMATQKRMILSEANVAAYMSVQTDDPFESREHRKKSFNLRNAGRRMGIGMTTY